MCTTRANIAPRLRAVPVFLLAVAWTAAVLTAAGLTSRWRTEAVGVDGLATDWPALDVVDRGVAVGAVNDDEFLHLVVTSEDAESAGLLATGLIVWLDASGRRAETFGLRLAGVVEPALPGMNPVPTNAPPAGSISGHVLDRFDLLGPARGQRRLVDVTTDLGVEVASGLAADAVIYELKVPLAKTAARMYAVGAAPGRTIGLGIATPEQPRNPGQRQRLVGNSGFIGGSPFRGGGFAPYREDDGRRKPLEVWTTLTLASKSS
jgi:hypothetical protein